MYKVPYIEATRVLDEIKGDFEMEFGSLQVIPVDRYDEVLQLIGDHFLPDAPVNSAFGMTRSPFIDSKICNSLQKNLSLMMVNRQTDELMGILVNEVGIRGEVVNFDGYPKSVRDHDSFFQKIQNDIDVFGMLDVDKVLKFSNLAVAGQYRRLRVGSQLMKAVVIFASKLGFTAITGEGDSVYSQKIFEKLGFEVLKEVPYDSYTHEGEPLGNRTGIHRSTKIYMKRM